MEIFYPELSGLTNHAEIFNIALENYIYNSGKLLQGGYDFNSRCYWHAFIWPVVEYLISEYEIKQETLKSKYTKQKSKYIGQINKDQIKQDVQELSKILYKGPIYRVTKNKPKFDGFICHCSYDLKDITKSYCCDPDTIYYWTIANTNNEYGLNVNEFYGSHNVDFEKEIIFPLQKKHIKEIFKGTYKEFCNHIKNI